MNVQHEAVKEFAQTELPDDFQSVPDVAKAAAPLQVPPARIDLDPLGPRRLVKERALDYRMSLDSLLDGESACLVHVS
jgi:hypothetical protein